MDLDGDGMEALFGSFMNEVTNIKSNKMKKIEDRIGTPDEIIERITASTYDPTQGFGSAYQILQISPEASESEVTKQYRSQCSRYGTAQGQTSKCVCSGEQTNTGHAIMAHLPYSRGRVGTHEARTRGTYVGHALGARTPGTRGRRSGSMLAGP